ncbi:MAG: hypothetical protein KF703_14395, partial [Actinobacteria bacterium]|nr:hypothetical protein [Actinomycetota bacterium]
RARGPVAGLLAYAFVLGVALTAGSGVPFEPLNAYAPILPLAATLVLAWAVASGVDDALAPTVVVASVCLQGYLPLAPTAAVAVLIAATCAVVPTLRPTASPRLPRRAWVTTVVVGLLVWSGPILDAVANRGGNVWRLATLDQAGAPTVGPEGAWRALLRLTSLPPAWLEPVPFRADDAGTFVSGGNASGVAVLVAAVAVVAWRWRRWDVGVRRIVLLAGAALATASGTLSRLPTEFVFEYQVGWVSVTGAFAALAVAVAVTAEADGPPRRLVALRPVAGGALLAGTVALLVVLAWPGELSRYSSVAAGSQRAAGALEGELGAGPRPGRPIAVFADGRSWEQVIANSVAMALEDRGRDIRVSPLIGEHWGTWRLARQAPDDPVLIVSDGWSPGVPAVGRRIARVEPDGWDGGVHADRTAARVAAWAREHGPVTVRPGLGGLLRSVVAGWVPELPCADLAALMEGRVPLDGLPDGAIAELYLEGVVSTPALPRHLEDAVIRDLVATPTEVWLADAAEARAGIDGPLAGRCT